ncbi:MAG: RNA polymerase sigma-70 factor (ECF subfamily) [Planctomycetota bacterium]|jgi:RNA polymerase sigma-70 factor (ECF subfamily)
MRTRLASRTKIPRRTTVTKSPRAGDDRELVERAKLGDESAFRQLLASYTPRIFSLVSGMISDRSEVEDVLQEVFFKVYRKMDGFSWKSAFYTWVYRIALNTATDHLKKRRNKSAASLEELTGFDVPDSAPAPSAGLSGNELRQALASAISELPEKYRNILVLREYEELAYEEIADVLDCSKGTVESRLFRARARLKEKMIAYLK